jgi:sugar lactone lactonase YvrE
MLQARRQGIMLAISIAVVIGLFSGSAGAQSNSYRTDENWQLQLPSGRTLGGVIGIDFDRKGNIWIFERCGSNASACSKSTLAPILAFDPSGKYLKSFGGGMFGSPHGFYVDEDDNVWTSEALVTEGKGHQVIKFSPEGKVLLTLGKAGVRGNGEDTFNGPTDIVVGRNGDIFVADGHGGNTNQRVVKFSRTGTFIKAWGRKGSAPGEFDTLHTLALDSRGRLFVGDRGNNRVQIFDQNGTFLDQWKQFGRPSGIFIDANDTIYVTDNESNEKNNPGVRKGIRIGNAKDGALTVFIPALGPEDKPTTVTEGVAADKTGNVYGAETATMNVRKYIKK